MFRPCIDLHEGKVKQIVGGTLGENMAALRTNFVSSRPSSWYAELYRRDGLRGGHVIMLGPGNETAAREALSAFPGGLQIGGGITRDNARDWLEAGASHVVVTSWVFRDGHLDLERLLELVRSIGKKRLVLDLSCRKRDGRYWVVTDRWQKFTKLPVDRENIRRLSVHCDEFLIHAVDVEGLCGGVDLQLVEMLAQWSPIPTTYAGGARSLEDLAAVEKAGAGRIDLTIGSALDIFGGTGVRYEDAVEFNRRHAKAPAKKTIVSFGEILWDLLPGGEVLGGAPFNFAYRAHSLGNKSLMISRLGNDERGRHAREQAALLGMDTRFLQSDATHPTGTVNVTLDARRSPSFSITLNVAFDFIEAEMPAQTIVAQADCFCFGTLVQRAPKSRATLRTLLDASPRSLKVLDLNLREECHTLEIIADSLARANVLKLNENEAWQLGKWFDLPDDSGPQFAAAALRKWPLTHCVITLGERGALAASALGEIAYTPGYRIAVADTCGSGDAFTAGFVHRLLRNDSLARCCDLGNTMGALVASQTGATTPISETEVQQFLCSLPSRIFDPSLRDFSGAPC